MEATVQELNQQTAEPIAAVERGGTVTVTRVGRHAATILPPDLVGPHYPFRTDPMGDEIDDMPSSTATTRRSAWRSSWRICSTRPRTRPSTAVRDPYRTSMKASAVRSGRLRGGSAGRPTATAPIGSQCSGRSRTSRTVSRQNIVEETQAEP